MVFNLRGVITSVEIALCNCVYLLHLVEQKMNILYTACCDLWPACCNLQRIVYLRPACIPRCWVECCDLREDNMCEGWSCPVAFDGKVSMLEESAKDKRNHWRLRTFLIDCDIFEVNPIFSCKIWSALRLMHCWYIICCVVILRCELYILRPYALISLVKLIVRVAWFHRQSCVLHLENETLLCELSYFLVCVSYFLPHERLFVIGIHWVWCCYAILLLWLHLFIDSTQNWYELRV